MNDNIIGIIGGMGPEATADFYMKLIKATQARTDQEHFRVIIDSNVKIPDRTKAILGQGESPIEAMVATARNLERAGVELACMPCMTAHYFIEAVQAEVTYPILDVFAEVRGYVLSFYPEVQRIGVLATTGTIQTGLFEKYLDKLTVIYPETSVQNERVMQAIYGETGIKSGNVAGEPLHLLQEAAEGLVAKGAELIISGCTEIGLVLKPMHVTCPLLDPMEIAARAMVSRFS